MRWTAAVLSMLVSCGGDADAVDGGGGATASPSTISATTGADASSVATSSTAAVSGAGGGPAEGAFFHLESPADSQRTWLVTPSGERIFQLGVNTAGRDKQCDGMPAYLRRRPPTEVANIEWARLSDGESNGYTADKPMCFNSVGAFSDTNDMDDTGGSSYLVRPSDEGGAGAPYSVVLNVAPRGDDRALRNESGVVLESGVAGVRIGDPFNPAFASDLAAMVAEDVAPRRLDPRLVSWHAGNEIGLFDRGGKSPGVRDVRRWIWAACPSGASLDTPTCAPFALGAYLRERYVDVAALNAAWEASYADFAAIVTSGPRPVPYVHDCNQTCREDLQRFVHDRLLRTWVDLVTLTVRAADPNHLVSSPRLAIGDASTYRFFTPASEPGSDVWIDAPDTKVPTSTDVVDYDPLDLLARVGDAGFDLVSVNVYTGDAELERPWITDGFHKLVAEAKAPINVSEFSIRARIPGWENRGGAFAFVPSDDATDDQVQRGARYRSQIEQMISFRDVIGASWHAYSDRYLAADPTHQINMGLVQCDDPARGFEAGRRWTALTERVAETNCTILDRIEAATGL